MSIVALPVDPKKCGTANYVRKYLSSLDECQKFVALLRADPDNIKLKFDAVMFDINLLAFVKDVTPELLAAAFKHDPMTLAYISDQSEELCIDAVRRNSKTFAFVKQQTFEICRIAVMDNPYNIRLVNDHEFIKRLRQ